MTTSGMETLRAQMADKVPVIDGLSDGWHPADAVEAIDIALVSGIGPAADIARAGLMLTHLLLRKNAAYGNSALQPLSVFSQAETRERLAIRMDDKLNRIVKGEAFGMENERIDLAGYLLLDYIAAHRVAS